MGEPHQGFVGEREQQRVALDAVLDGRPGGSGKCVAFPPREFVSPDIGRAAPFKDQKDGIGCRAMPPRRQATAHSFHMKAHGRHGRRC